jgi:Uma2 family endonuclease
MPHLPARPHLTYEELSRLPADGHRYELFDGEAYRCPSTTSRHQRVLGRIFLVFGAGVPEGAEVFLAPLDVVFAPSTALQPDLLVVLPKNAGIVRDVIRGVPDLVVEVLSPSTAAIDRGLKMETYARHSVPEYWIADSEKELFEIYRLDWQAIAYRLGGIYRRGDKVTTPFLPGLEVDVTWVF